MARARARARATKQQWCDMPSEILSRVVEHLNLIDRLRFRAACKDFLRAAASYCNTSTAEAESIPWFLAYGEKYCSLLTSSNERYTNLSFKELQGATVLASVEGWLLVFKRGSMFFFCPFSGARIDLPNLPYSELTNHVAAFSSPPTFICCTVAIISRSSDDYLQLNVISRVSWHWTSYKFYVHREVIDTIKAVSCREGGKFYFLADPKDGLKVEFFAYRPGDYTGRQNAFVPVKITNNNNNNNNNVAFPAAGELPKGPLGVKELIKWVTPNGGFGDLLYEAAEAVGIKEMLCLDEDVELSTCGTEVGRTLLFNEIIKSTSQPRNGASIRRVKGVWILPRSHQISTHDTWFL